MIANPISTFGGIMAFNTKVNKELAKEIREFRGPLDGETWIFYEIAIATKYVEKAQERKASTKDASREEANRAQ